jgi:hypothetical protein
MRAALHLALLLAACGGSEFKSRQPGDGGAVSPTDAGVEASAPVVDAGVAASCKDILRLDTTRAGKSDLYTITTSTGAVKVWCDMAIDGGGWTLVARAVTGALAPTGQEHFGWSGAMGAPDADGKPYSLDVFAHPISFTEILVGVHEVGTKAFTGNAFKFKVPATFLNDFQTTPFSMPAPTPVGRSCTPNTSGGWMFSFAGYTRTSRDEFFFRDNNQEDQWGLLYDRWSLADDDANPKCDRSGELHNKPGMIFVR